MNKRPSAGDPGKFTASPTPMSTPMATPTAGLSLKRRKKYRLRRMQYNGIALPEDTGVGAAAEEVERLKVQLNAAHAAAREAQERALRSVAEVDNQRRRHQKEKEDLRRFAAEEIMRELIQPLDHFGLALQSLSAASDVNSVRTGVEMIHRELVGVLKSAGLEEVRPVGAAFDVAQHEAVATGNDPSKPEGTVLEVMRSGWTLRGRTLRAAMVRVNRPS